jgi:predicted ATPase
MDELRNLRSLQENFPRELNSVIARQGEAKDQQQQQRQQQQTAQSVISVQERVDGIASAIESVQSRLQALDCLSDESSHLS